MTENYSIEKVSLQEEDLSLLDVIRVFVDNMRLLVFLPLLIGVVATLLVYFFVHPRFTSVVKFVAPQPPQSVGAGALSALGLQGLGGGIGASLRNPTDIYLAFMSSNRIRDGIIDQFNLTEQFKGLTRDEMRSAVGSQAEIVIGRDGIVTVSVTDKNPQRAADIANQYPILLQDMLADYAVNEAKLRRSYLIKQVDQMREKIKKQEMDLKQTGLSGDMLKLDMNSSVSEIANLRSAIAAQEIRLRSLASYLAPAAPEYRLAEGELNSLRSQLRKVENAHTQQSSSNSSYPDKYRSYLYDLQLLENLIKQAELAQIDANKEEILVQVMDLAEPAPSKSGPSYRNTLIISILLSGFMLLVWVYLRFGVRRARASHPLVNEKIDLLAQSWRNVWRIQ
jgi:uncharacterized protein involved in exopolysaccharide biosynthesis